MNIFALEEKIHVFHSFTKVDFFAELLGQHFHVLLFEVSFVLEACWHQSIVVFSPVLGRLEKNDDIWDVRVLFELEASKVEGISVFRQFLEGIVEAKVLLFDHVHLLLHD